MKGVLMVMKWFSTLNVAVGSRNCTWDKVTEGCACTLDQCQFPIFFKKFIFYFWLCWIFSAAQAFVQLRREGADLLLRCAGFSLWRLLLLRSTRSRARGLSGCSSWALCAQLLHRMWDPPRPGIKPVFCIVGRQLYLKPKTLPLSYQGSPQVSLLLISQKTWCEFCHRVTYEENVFLI